MNFIDWLIHTNAGLCTRIAIGSAIFIFLAIADLLKNGSAANRWREYIVLLAAVLAALLCGAINDQITSSISWEYFYYGKDLEHILGPQIPLAPLAPDFQDMTRANIFRPSHFICTWGIHLGGYIGGFLGTLLAAAIVIQKRSKLKKFTPYNGNN